MNKGELINAMAEKADLSKTEAKRALDAFTDTVHDALGKGEKVSMIGFGTFSVLQRSERIGINPATRQQINIPAKKAIKFKASSELTKSVK